MGVEGVPGNAGDGERVPRAAFGPRRTVLSRPAGVGRLQASEAGCAGWRWPAVGDGGVPEAAGAKLREPGVAGGELEGLKEGGDKLREPADAGSELEGLEEAGDELDGLELPAANSERVPRGGGGDGSGVPGGGGGDGGRVPGAALGPRQRVLSRPAGIGRLQTSEAGGASWRWPAVGDGGGSLELPMTPPGSRRVLVMVAWLLRSWCCSRWDKLTAL